MHSCVPECLRRYAVVRCSRQCVAVRLWVGVVVCSRVGVVVWCRPLRLKHTTQQGNRWCHGGLEETGSCRA